jgi:hypothetical protein
MSERGKKKYLNAFAVKAEYGYVFISHFWAFFVPGINPLANPFKSGLIKIFFGGFGSRTGMKVSYDGQDIIDIKTSRTSQR